jgi:hypothetical protein
VVPFWGIPPILRFPFPSSALVIWDSGSPPAPPPISPGKGHDPHGDPGKTPAAQEQAMLFLLTGKVFDTCGGRPCLGVRTSGWALTAIALMAAGLAGLGQRQA